MTKWLKLVFFSVFSLATFFLATPIISQQNQCSRDQGLTQYIDCLQESLDKFAKQKQSLSREIETNKTKIRLTSAQIAKTEEEIETLVTKIGRLEISLDTLAQVLGKRIAATYKKGEIDPLALFFSSRRFSDFVTRYKYLKVIQLHDKKLLYAMEATRTNYDEQKIAVEQLKAKLETQRALLDKQKREAESFLEITKNNEKRYQELLSEAKRELEALRASEFTGKKHVEQGEIIGLMGNTGFSFGDHLHFGVYNLREEDADKFDYFSNVENPFNFLVSKNITFQASSCDDVSTVQTKVVGSGSWSWPMTDPTISQCFGHTPWSWRYSDNFHHGVDMYNEDIYTIRAVGEGEAYFYRGKSAMGNNVRLFHKDGKMSLYLHLQ